MLRRACTSILCVALANGLAASATSPFQTRRLGSSALVAISALLPQPIFYTAVGGAFHTGDVARSAQLRLGRAAWHATASLDVLAVLALAAAWHYGSRLALAALRPSRSPRSS